MWASSRPNKRRELDVHLIKTTDILIAGKKEVPTTLTRLTPPELLPACWSHNSSLEGFLVDPDDYDEINDDQGDDGYNWWYKLFVVYVMMTMVIRPMMMMMIDDMHCLFCYAKEERGDDAVATSLPTSSTHTISSLWTYWWSLLIILDHIDDHYWSLWTYWWSSLIILDHIEYSWSSVAYW